MPTSDGLITAPVNLEDPYRCLGVGAYNGVFDQTYICSNLHGKINSWSKYKPVRLSAIHTEGSPNWWKAQDGNCGFNIPPLNSIVANKDWVYEEAGNGWWKRINDFIGYDHKATTFIDYADVKVNVTTSRNGFTIKGTINNSNLTPSDFSSGTIKDTYLTCCVKDFNVYYIKSAADLFVNGGVDVSFTWNEFKGTANSPGTYEVYVLLSKFRYAVGGPNTDIVNNSIFKVPCAKNPISLNVTYTAAYGIRLLKMGTTFNNSEDVRYYDLNPDLLDYDEYGEPVYTGNNGLVSNGQAYLIFELYNETDIVQSVTVSDSVFSTENFRHQFINNISFVLYTDSALTQKATVAYIPANGTLRLYARDNFFARFGDGGAFVPTLGQTIAPANIAFKINAGEGAGQWGGFVVQAKP